MSEELFQLPAPELEAVVYYLTTEEGGRQSDIGYYYHYRPQFHYDNIDCDAMQQFLDKKTCKLGELVRVYLQTLSPEYHKNKFYVGKNFEIREGSRIVGKGIIIKVLREDFLKRE